jgi:two-component system sensor histidine kinase/response regulator
MSEQPQARPSILAVDDTPENLRLLNGVLSSNGYEVRPVTSGRMALQSAERSAPDLVLLDVSMPEMDGYEVCERLKAHETLRDIPVIFLTANVETEAKLRGFEAGGVDYIAKPFQVAEVLARVRVHVSLVRARQELARNYEQLRALEKLRDDLVHMVVHDMRSPLLGILMHLSALRKRLTDREDLIPSVDAVMRSSRNLSKMTNELLDISRMEEGKMNLQPEACDLSALVREVTTAFDDGSRRLEIDCRESIGVECDSGLIRRVLENLVSNGLKHTPAGTVVEVSAVPGELVARLCIRDRGNGVPAEARERIFEKFGAIPTEAGREYHSAGLGLAFCKLVIHAHGGRIGVNSRDGGGSEFWFELPSRIAERGR